MAGKQYPKGKSPEHWIVSSWRALSTRLANSGTIFKSCVVIQSMLRRSYNMYWVWHGISSNNSRENRVPRVHKSRNSDDAVCCPVRQEWKPWPYKIKWRSMPNRFLTSRLVTRLRLNRSYLCGKSFASR